MVRGHGVHSYVITFLLDGSAPAIERIVECQGDSPDEFQECAESLSLGGGGDPCEATMLNVKKVSIHQVFGLLLT